MSLAEQIMPEDYIFPPKPAPLNDAEKAEYKARIKQLLKDNTLKNKKIESIKLELLVFSCCK